MGAAQFYLARRARWYDRSDSTTVEISVNGQAVNIEEQTAARDDLELIRALTPNERAIMRALLERAARRLRGEAIVDDALPTQLLLEPGYEIVEDDDPDGDGGDPSGGGVKDEGSLMWFESTAPVQLSLQRVSHGTGL